MSETNQAPKTLTIPLFGFISVLLFIGLIFIINFSFKIHEFSEQLILIFMGIVVVIGLIMVLPILYNEIKENLE